MENKILVKHLMNDLQNELKERKKNSIGNDNLLIEEHPTGLVILSNNNKCKLRIRVTETNILFRETDSDFDYIIGKVDGENYVILEHLESNIVRDCFTYYILKDDVTKTDGKKTYYSTSRKKNKYISYENLVIALILLLS